MKNIFKYLKQPGYIFVLLDNRNIFCLSDEKYIKLLYRLKMKKNLNLNNPKTFNEKLQWLKLYDRKDIYTTMVDKYEAKRYVANIIGEEYIIPTLGIYDNFDEIDFDKLPNQFVIKCTHDSGGLVIVKDKNKIDIESTKNKINNSLRNNYYYSGREWPYKNVKPRIIIEEYKEDTKYHELRDYKIFCFNGRAEIVFVASNRQGDGDTYFDFFNRKLEHLPFENGHPNAPYKVEVPKTIQKMFSLAEKLSKNIPEVRIDFYDVNGKIYFGEITFFHWSGFVPFNPEEWDYKLGEMIELPK